MKRLILLILCIFLLVGTAQAVTIESLTLQGGNGTTLGTWSATIAVWTTDNVDHWVLGVSDVEGGPLVNQSNGTISGLSLGEYFLYADPYAWGNNPKLSAVFSDSTTHQAIFTVNGINGSGTPWTWLDGDPNVTLGWADQTYDLVGINRSLVPNGITDMSLKADLVPLPGAVWLLGTGLVGLAGLRRRFGC